MPIACLILALPALTIDNVAPGEVFRYPVISVAGTAAGDTVAIGRDWATAGRFPAVNGRFKALVELRPGRNRLVMQSGTETGSFEVEYRPPTSPLRVLAVWVHAKDEPVDESTAFRKQFDTGLKMIQTFYGEAMRNAGYGRKSFPLELDAAGRVKIHVITLPKTGDGMRAMENNASWGFIYGQLAKQFPEQDTKWCAMLGFTRWDPETKRASGHYALGGGALGAFGSASMPYWPADLAGVTPTFLDGTELRPDQFDDSAYRGTVWANVSTAWGAMAHEMGHAFGLPHSNDKFSVMSRGFDRFNRVFALTEPPIRGRTTGETFGPDEIARWDKYSAAKLNWSPYLQADFRRSNVPAPRITVVNDTVRISTQDGIRVWGADTDDRTPFFREYRNQAGPKVVTESVTTLRERLGNVTGPFRVTVVDSHGGWISTEVGR